MIRVALKGCWPRPSAHDPDRAGHRARRRDDRRARSRSPTRCAARPTRSPRRPTTAPTPSSRRPAAVRRSTNDSDDPTQPTIAARRSTRSRAVPGVGVAAGDITDRGQDPRPATASPSATARTSASASTPAAPGAAKLTPVPPDAGPLGDRPRRGRHRRRHRREAAPARRRQRRASRPPARRAASRVVGIATLRHGQVARHRDDRGVRPARRAEAVRQGRARTTRSSSPARGGVPAAQVRRNLAAALPQRQGPDGRQAGPLHARRAEAVHLDHQGRPAGLRRRRDPRRRVHDLQLAVDHRRPAHARVRAAADGRRLAPPGAALGRAPRRWPSAPAAARSASPPASGWPRA